VQFYAQAEEVVTMATSELGVNCDTYVELYRADGTTLIDSNDDVGPMDWSSYLVWTVDETDFTW